MPAAAEPYRNPYTPYPGGSTASVSMSPEEGRKDLWAFFWLTLVDTAIIAGAGIVVWLYFR